MTDIRNLIKTSKQLYQKIGKVYCSVLQADVHFTSEGFFHLLNHSHNRPRNVNDRYLRLKCLPYASEVVEKCTHISEIRRVTKKIKGKKKDVISYELIYKKSSQRKYKVVVQKVGAYSKYYKFASVMPLSRRSRGKNKKKRYKKRS